MYVGAHVCVCVRACMRACVCVRACVFVRQVIWLTIGTNGGLKSLTAQGQELVLFSYHGNSGLLATKSIQIGWTTFYE